MSESSEIPAPTSETVLPAAPLFPSLSILADLHRRDSETQQLSQEGTRVQIIISFATDPNQAKKFFKNQNSLFLVYKPSECEVS